MATAIQTTVFLAPGCARRTVTQRHGRAYVPYNVANSLTCKAIKTASRGVSFGVGRSVARGPLRIRSTTENESSVSKTKVEIVDTKIIAPHKEDRTKEYTELAIVVA
eukprot:6144511-Pyramimonas_sp.AAC.1